MQGMSVTKHWSYEELQMRKEVIPGYGDGCADHVWRIIKGVCEEHQESVDPERTRVENGPTYSDLMLGSSI